MAYVEKCPICDERRPSMKIGEELGPNQPPRHNLTMYLCHTCFTALLTPPASEWRLTRVPKSRKAVTTIRFALAVTALGTLMFTGALGLRHGFPSFIGSLGALVMMGGAMTALHLHLTARQS